MLPLTWMVVALRVLLSQMVLDDLSALREMGAGRLTATASIAFGVGQVPSSLRITRHLLVWRGGFAIIAVAYLTSPLSLSQRPARWMTLGPHGASIVLLSGRI
jgi:hypothetical protein